MHKCIRCAEIYQDNDSTILRGCKKCGSIFFLYIKSPEQEQEIQKIEKALEQRDTTLEKEITKEIEKIAHVPDQIPPAENQQPQNNFSTEIPKTVGKKKEQEIKFGIETFKI